jgi:hypothetical protein
MFGKKKTNVDADKAGEQASSAITFEGISLNLFSVENGFR